MVGGGEVEAAKWRRGRRASGKYMIALVGLMLWGDEKEILDQNGR